MQSLKSFCELSCAPTRQTKRYDESLLASQETRRKLIYCWVYIKLTLVFRFPNLMQIRTVGILLINSQVEGIRQSIYLTDIFLLILIKLSPFIACHTYHAFRILLFCHLFLFVYFVCHQILFLYKIDLCRVFHFCPFSTGKLLGQFSSLTYNFYFPSASAAIEAGVSCKVKCFMSCLRCQRYVRDSLGTLFQLQQSLNRCNH